MIFARAALIAAFAMLVSTSPVATQESGESPSPAAAAEGSKQELTPEERAERQARKACKIKICDILATKDPQGDDVSCDIVKTWRESDITKMLAAGSTGRGARPSASRSSTSSASSS